MPNKENLVPFKKGDARINRAGRPKNFDLLHEIAVRLCAERNSARRMARPRPCHGGARFAGVGAGGRAR